MSIKHIFVNFDEGREASEVITHYIKYKEEYPRHYYDFFLHWNLINPLYNACSSKDYEALRIIDFGKKMEIYLWDDTLESLSKELVDLECVGDGRDDARPNKYVRLATLHLRKEFQLKSNTCSTCRKKDYCEQEENDDFHKLDAIMRILYQIRCNLFHGDKLELTRRNKKLVRIGNNILTEILQRIADKYQEIFIF